MQSGLGQLIGTWPNNRASFLLRTDFSFGAYDWEGNIRTPGMRARQGPLPLMPGDPLPWVRS